MGNHWANNDWMSILFLRSKLYKLDLNAEGLTLCHWESLSHGTGQTEFAYPKALGVELVCLMGT